LNKTNQTHKKNKEHEEQPKQTQQQQTRFGQNECIYMLENMKGSII